MKCRKTYMRCQKTCTPGCVHVQNQLKPLRERLCPSVQVQTLRMTTQNDLKLAGREQTARFHVCAELSNLALGQGQQWSTRGTSVVPTPLHGDFERGHAHLSGHARISADE